MLRGIMDEMLEYRAVMGKVLVAIEEETMRFALLSSTLLLALTVGGSAMAEYRVYKHAGCTKDRVRVSQELIWDCEGICRSTPLKAEIIRQAKESRAVYPRIIGKYTQAQIRKFTHLKEIRTKIRMKAPLRANPASFGGKC